MTTIRGRKPLPDAIKDQKGTLRPSRVTKNQPVTTMIEALPEAPFYLDETAAKVWDQLVDQLDRQGMLAKTDYTVLSAYCLEWSAYLTCQAKEQAGERYYETYNSDGIATSKQIHPIALLADRHLKRVMELAVQFGFTPTARSRISVPANTNKQETTVKKLLKKTGT